MTEQVKERVHMIDRIKDVRQRVKLALKLEQVYEFENIDNVVKLVTEKPLVSHSWTDVRNDISPAKSVRLGRGKDDVIDLFPGVMAILGKSGSGKTRTAFQYMFKTLNQAKKGSAHYIKLFEPGDEDKYLIDDVSVPTFEIEAAGTIAQLLLNSTVETIFVDSFRYLFYGSSGGATGKGGVNMSLFMDLTHLDSVARSFGKTIVVVINPMTDDDAAFNFYLEAAVGAVTSVLTMESYLNAKHTSREYEDRSQRYIKLSSSPEGSKDRRTTQNATTAGHSNTATKGVDLFDRNPKRN